MASVIAEKMSEATRGVGSLMELIPWLVPVNDGIVLNKDGSMTAVLAYRPMDSGGSTAEEKMILGAATESAIESIASDPVLIQMIMVRSPDREFPTMPHPSRVGARIDAAYRDSIAQRSNFRNEYFLAVTVFPEKAGAESFLRLVGGYVGSGDVGVGRAIRLALRDLMLGTGRVMPSLRALEQLAGNLEGKIGALSNQLQMISPRRLRGEEFFGMLHALANPLRSPSQRKRIGPNGLLDTLLAEQGLRVYRNVLEFNGEHRPVYASALTFRDLPEAVGFNALFPLYSTACGMIVAVSFLAMPRDQALRHLKAVRMALNQQRFTTMEWIMAGIRQENTPDERKANVFLTERMEEVNTLYQAVDAGLAVIGKTNYTLMLLDESLDLVQGETDRLLRYLQSSPFVGAIRESIHLLSSWTATLPGSHHWVRRWLCLTARNACDLMQWIGVSEGQRENSHFTAQFGGGKPVPALTVAETRHHTKYHFNFHHGAIGHTFVVGPTRSGKSLVMNFLISQFLKYTPHARVYIFDKDYSCRIPTILQGGDYIDFKDESQVRINPVDLARSPNRNDRRFLVRWVLSLLEIRGYTPDEKDEKAIAEAVDALHRLAGGDEKRVVDMDALLVHLPPHLVDRLQAWTRSGTYGALMGERDSFSLSDFQAFDITELLRDPTAARVVMDYIFYRIQREIEGDLTKATLLYVEECWFMIEDANFAGRLRDWLKTFAKFNGFVVLCTQSLEDFVRMEPHVFAAIRDNIPNRIFLPNPGALSEKLKETYASHFSVTEEQLQAIGNGKPQREYYLVRPDTAQMVEFRIPQEAVNLLRSDAVARLAFERALAKIGIDKRRRDSLAATYLAELARASGGGAGEGTSGEGEEAVETADEER